MKLLIPIIALSALPAMTAFATAASTEPVSVLIPVSGVLSDAADSAIDGDTTVRFSLYSSAIGDEAVWQEETVVPVASGAFATYLGTIEPLDAAVFREHPRLYFAMAVADDAELGRWPLDAAPYAAYAAYTSEATTLSGHAVDDLVNKAESISSSMIAENSITAQQLDFDAATQADMEDTFAPMLRTSDTVAWEKLTDIPSGLADGIDNVGGAADDLSCDGCVSAAELDYVPVTQTQLAEQLADVLRQAQLDGIVTDVVHQAQLVDALHDVVRQSGLDVTLADVLRQAQLDEALTGVVRELDLDDALVSYTKHADFDAQMSSVAHQSTLDAALIDAVHRPAFESSIADAVRQADLGVVGTINQSDNLVDWTRLKNVPAGIADGTDAIGGQASDLACSGCVGASQLDFAMSTQSALDTHKTSGDHDARYAIPTGDVVINGDLTVSGKLVVGVRAQTCTVTAGALYSSCSCAAGEMAIAGGTAAYPFNAAGEKTHEQFIRESRPVWINGVSAWQVSCVNSANNYRAVDCGTVYVTCARMR